MKLSTKVWISTIIGAIIGIILALNVYNMHNVWVTTISAFVLSILNSVFVINGIIKNVYAEEDIDMLKYEVEQLKKLVKFER